MVVHISSGLLNSILTDARADPLRERCGLLLGRGNLILEFLPAANVASVPTRRFEIDPVVLIAAHRAARNGGPAILGHYHFHPSDSPNPSLSDAASAQGDGALWLIATMHDFGLWRAMMGGALHHAFEPCELALSSD
jgi:desampylase